MSKILSRFSELKAFLKSIFRITYSGFCSFSMRFRKTCAAISPPRLVPQPNCVPWKSIRRWSVAKELTHFEHIRRRVFPTAIGRILPSFFPKTDKFSTKEKMSQTYRDFAFQDNTLKKTFFHEDESWLDECRKIVYIQSHEYIFNSSTLFNNVPMAQWSTLWPCNREAAGSNLSGVLAFI